MPTVLPRKYAIRLWRTARSAASKIAPIVRFWSMMDMLPLFESVSVSFRQALRTACSLSARVAVFALAYAMLLVFGVFGTRVAPFISAVALIGGLFGSRAGPALRAEMAPRNVVGAQKSRPILALAFKASPTSPAQGNDDVAQNETRRGTLLPNERSISRLVFYA